MTDVKRRSRKEIEELQRRGGVVRQVGTKAPMAASQAAAERLEASVLEKVLAANTQALERVADAMQSRPSGWRATVVRGKDGLMKSVDIVVV